MNRRSFLASLAATATGIIAPVPEPVRRYFFAPAGGWSPRPTVEIEDWHVGLDGKAHMLGPGGVWWPREILTGEEDAAPFINELLAQQAVLLPRATFRIGSPLIIPSTGYLDGGHASFMHIEHTGPAVIAHGSGPGERPTKIANVNGKFVNGTGECGVMVVPYEEIGEGMMVYGEST